MKPKQPKHRPRRLQRLIAGVVLVGGIAAVAVVATRADDTPVGTVAPVEPAERGATANAPAPAPDESEAPSPAAPLPRKLPSVEARQRLERDIAAARQKRLARAPAPRKEPAAAPDEGAEIHFDREYFMERMRELLPMVKECYEAALETNPTLHGKLVVDFEIIGEPEVGGLVERSEIIAEESTLHDDGVAECVRETMYALEVEPPPSGGSIRVRYPITFSTRDDNK